MACFFIDYENQSGRVLEGLSLIGLKESDELIFFYSEKSSRITMELHRELETIPAKKLYIKVRRELPNALDFQLSTYLGACIQKNPKKKYFIISKDSGYDCVCRFWRDKNIFVKRIERFCYYTNTTANSYHQLLLTKIKPLLNVNCPKLCRQHKNPLAGRI